MKRGRAVKLNASLIKETVLKYKEEIINEKLAIISKSNDIWIKIAEELKCIMSPQALYTYVMCNRNGMRDQLNRFRCNDSNNFSRNSPVQKQGIPIEKSMDITCSDITSNNITCNNSDLELHKTDNIMSFTISIPKEDFMAMIIVKKYYSKKNKNYRQYTVLQSGVWQHTFCEKIWEATKLQCGFNFKNHKLTVNGESGYANGTCKCGETIKCMIDNCDEIVTKIKCTFIEGQGRCGKRYLRGPIRDAVAEKLKTKSVMQYRTELADELMTTNDTIEPPHLFSTNVLHVAKHEKVIQEYLHKDPLKALLIMQIDSHENIIHSIGLNPFYVHYWLNHQLDVYRSYGNSEVATIYIDATGSIIKKIKRPNENKSKHIFLYNCVINSEKGGMFPVCQMLSESHNTNSIQFWLLEWMRTGAPAPREVVTDFSRALITAAVRVFTGHATMENYANNCKDDNLPSCFIRIDVAHFIKMYANFLKGVRKGVRQFYLSMLGQLILVRNIEDAEELVTIILTIARSETEGETASGELTTCEQFKIKIKNEMVFNEETDDEQNIPDEKLIDDDESLISTTNKWYEWARQIDEKVKMLIGKDDGDRQNANYMPSFADRLIRDLKLFPLWSCVCRDRFGYGRIPASSASAESEFNIVKNVFFKNEATPMRADMFVSKHTKFLSGRLKISKAAIQSTSTPIDSNAISSTTTIIDTATDIAAATITNSHAVSNSPDNFDCIIDNGMSDNANLECPVCANGDEPTGAHSCFICKKFVHAIEPCSAPISEEGYGQKRVCKECKGISCINDIIACSEVENWRGLGNEQKKSGKYLQKETKDYLQQIKFQRIPIIKNGNNISVKAVKIGKEYFSLSNTCAFDSILQLFVAAFADVDNIKEGIEIENNLFFKLANNISLKGLSSNSYRLRAEILKKYMENKQLPNNCMLLNCEVNAAYLCTKIFHETPSLTEISQCSKDCMQRRKALPVIQMKFHLFMQKKFNEIEDEILIKGSRQCFNKDCNGEETTQISETAPFLILELYQINGAENFTKLQDIPHEINFSFIEQQYKLLGIVHYEGPRKTRKSFTEIGHYTAVCFRKQNTWIKYDDMKEKEIIMKKTNIVNPALIVYTI